jgi:hypothetical protein
MDRTGIFKICGNFMNPFILNIYSFIYLNRLYSERQKYGINSLKIKQIFFLIFGQF